MSEWGEISTWKKQLKEGVAEIFSKKRGRAQEDSSKAEKRLYEEIGRLKMELDWLKKKSGFDAWAEAKSGWTGPHKDIDLSAVWIIGTESEQFVL